MKRSVAKEYLHLDQWLNQIALYTERGAVSYAEPMVQDACDALLMRIGEAANRLSRLDEPDPFSVPWHRVVSLRNWLIHGYDVIDRELVWETISVALPTLHKDLMERIAAAHRVVSA